MKSISFKIAHIYCIFKGYIKVYVSFYDNSLPVYKEIRGIIVFQGLINLLALVNT